jgi:hypothetical protein
MGRGLGGRRCGVGMEGWWRMRRASLLSYPGVLFSLTVTLHFPLVVFAEFCLLWAGGKNYWATGHHHSLSGLQQALLTSTTRLPAHTRALDIPGNTAMDKLSVRI